MDNENPSTLEYLDFELLIDFGQGQQYPVNVIHSPAGELTHDVAIRLPFAVEYLERFLNDLPFLVIRSSNMSQSQTMSDEQHVRDFGQQLFEMLFREDLGRLYRASQVEAEQQGKGLRLKLRIRPPELATLPWEFLFDSDRDDYVNLSHFTPIVRYLEVERSIRPLEVQPPLRVLGMAVNPKRMLQVNAAQERFYLTEALRDLSARHLVELSWWEGGTWHDLQAAMRAGPWHVFHFIGHGSFRPDADEGAIILADESDQPYRLSASDFAQLLVDHRSLRVVILNACQSSQSNPRNIFSSTAATLVRRGIPAVLAMQYPFTDLAAVQFGRELYQALAAWLPIEAAVGEARKAVRLAISGSLEWGTATLYLRAPNGTLFAPARETEPSTARGLRLHNLPARYEFAGREAKKAQVHAALRSRTPVVSIEGIGGIGKTALALEVAYECLATSAGTYPIGESAIAFTGIVWLTAKDSTLTLNRLLDTIAEVVEYGGLIRLPLKEKQVAIRRVLQTQPYLVVLDNFETITDEGVHDFLTNLPEPSKALITTREQRLPEAQIISLHGLTEIEGITLIRSEGKRLGLGSLERAEDTRLVELHQATGGAPLAIKWAVGQIKQRGQTFDIILRALHDAQGNVFAVIFDRAWALLLPNVQQVLCVMSIFAAPVSRAGLQAACGFDDYTLDEALGQLLAMSLVDATDELDLARMRYSIHPLTRAYAAARLKQEPGLQDVASQRLAEYYTTFTTQYGGFWSQAGFIQIEAELPNILSLLRWFWDQTVNRPVASIFNNIIDFLIIRGYWNDLIAASHTALTLALKEADELNVARVRVKALAWVERHQGELDAAETHIQLALPVFERHGEKLEFYYAQRNLGRIAEQRGEFERAEQLLAECLEFFQSVGDERHIYLTTANLAKVALERGDLDTAWALCDRVIEAARQFDDPERIASLLKVMGEVALRRGDHQQANILWSEGLSHSQRANRLDEVADAQFRLAQIEIETGEMSTARQLLVAARETYQKLGFVGKVGEIERLLGD
ncbi:hypothetical protein TFLX_03988 [Thermoflexales bacterium]|nr:hypothetical protein TFLX_03988 [Thermoflexales bacterium]